MYVDLYDPRDITPMDVFEYIEWIGLQGKCNKCHRLFTLHIPYVDASCPMCQFGWIRANTRLVNDHNSATYHKHFCGKDKT